MPNPAYNPLATRDIISRAIGVLNTGATLAAAKRSLAADFPDRPNDEIAYAARTAREYVRAAENVRTVYERDPAARHAQWEMMGRRGDEPPEPRVGGKNPPGRTIGELGGRDFADIETVGITVFVLATLENGDVLRTSAVLNVPANAPIYTIYSRATAALCLGYIKIGRGRGYKIRECQVSIATMTPYARGLGIRLDTDPINRRHPNPYPPRER